jgi:hypothetical protein
MDDLEERVFGQLPDETWVYPGHGDDTTLGADARRFRSGGPRLVSFGRRFPGPGSVSTSSLPPVRPCILLGPRGPEPASHLNRQLT